MATEWRLVLEEPVAAESQPVSTNEERSDRFVELLAQVGALRSEPSLRASRKGLDTAEPSTAFARHFGLKLNALLPTEPAAEDTAVETGADLARFAISTYECSGCPGSGNTCTRCKSARLTRPEEFVSRPAAERANDKVADALTMVSGVPLASLLPTRKTTPIR